MWRESEEEEVVEEEEEQEEKEATACGHGSRSPGSESKFKVTAYHLVSISRRVPWPILGQMKPLLFRKDCTGQKHCFRLIDKGLIK